MDDKAFTIGFGPRALNRAGSRPQIPMDSVGILHDIAYSLRLLSDRLAPYENNQQVVLGTRETPLGIGQFLTGQPVQIPAGFNVLAWTINQGSTINIFLNGQSSNVPDYVLEGGQSQLFLPTVESSIVVIQCDAASTSAAYGSVRFMRY
jgi:hypothetical protein